MTLFELAESFYRPGSPLTNKNDVARMLCQRLETVRQRDGRDTKRDVPGLTGEVGWSARLNNIQGELER